MSRRPLPLAPEDDQNEGGTQQRNLKTAYSPIAEIRKRRLQAAIDAGVPTARAKVETFFRGADGAASPEIHGAETQRLRTVRNAANAVVA